MIDWQILTWIKFEAVNPDLQVERKMQFTAFRQKATTEHLKVRHSLGMIRLKISFAKMVILGETTFGRVRCDIADLFRSQWNLNFVIQFLNIFWHANFEFV